ncbi:dihydrofolate reductase family protein [Anaerolineales bacterium]
MQITNRKLVYYVAMTVDHYIAHEDDTVDGFATDGHHIHDYITSLHEYDTVLMGRRTYEWAYAFGVQPGQPVPTYGHMMQYVFSRSMPDYEHKQLRIIREDPAAFVRGLKAEEGGPIYLCGGGQLAASLLGQGLVDELILKVNPVIFGCGIAVFGDLKRNFTLSLLDTKVYNNGVIFLHYHLHPVSD